jgi:hypothetical protein
MTKARIDLLWFIVAIVFFLMAMTGAKNKAVFWALFSLSSASPPSEKEK